MLAGELITDARVDLFDPAPGAGWSDEELLGDLNLAIATTCSLRHDAYTVREALPMAYGTRQELPERGLVVMDLYENVESLRAVTLAERTLIDHQNRFWQRSTYERDVQHWCTDERDPRRFIVTPPNDGYGAVWCLYGAAPAPLAAATDEIPLPEAFHPALRLFVVGQALAKPSKRQDKARSADLMTQYRQALGLNAQAQAAASATPARAASGG